MKKDRKIRKKNTKPGSHRKRSKLGTDWGLESTKMQLKK